MFRRLNALSPRVSVKRSIMILSCARSSFTRGALMLNHPEMTIRNDDHRTYLSVEVLLYAWVIVSRFHDLVWHDQLACRRKFLHPSKRTSGMPRLSPRRSRPAPW